MYWNDPDEPPSAQVPVAAKLEAEKSPEDPATPAAAATTTPVSTAASPVAAGIEPVNDFAAPSFSESGIGVAT